MDPATYETEKVTFMSTIQIAKNEHKNKGKIRIEKEVCVIKKLSKINKEK